MAGRRWSTTGSVVALVAIALSVLAGSAGGTVVEREQYMFPYTNSFEFCGISIQVEGVEHGQFRVRQGKGAQASAFFGRDTNSYRETWTNAANGRWLVLRGHQTFNDVKARRVEGNVFEFRSNQAGQPFVIEDSSGRVVVRDRGVIRFDFLFDTFGDTDPESGEFVADGDVQLHGPHPSFADDFDFCAVVTDLIG